MAKKAPPKKKIRRPLKARIAEQRRKLAEMEEKERKGSLTTALEDGRVAEDDQPAFKKLKKESGALSRAASITSDRGEEKLSKELRALSLTLGKQMQELIGEPSSGKEESSEEPEEETGEDELGEGEEWEEEEEEED